MYTAINRTVEYTNPCESANPFREKHYDVGITSGHAIIDDSFYRNPGDDKLACERFFPMKLLETALSFRFSDGQAFRPVDTERGLESIGRKAQT